MWDLPGPGLEPVSPALAGEFLTTVPPGKSLNYFYFLQDQPSSLIERLNRRCVYVRETCRLEGCGLGGGFSLETHQMTKYGKSLFVSWFSADSSLYFFRGETLSFFPGHQCQMACLL